MLQNMNKLVLSLFIATEARSRSCASTSQLAAEAETVVTRSRTKDKIAAELGTASSHLTPLGTYN